MNPTNDRYAFIVEPEDAGTRIDAYLVGALPQLSRTRIQTLLKSEAILLNQKPVKASHKLEADDEISCHIPEPQLLEVMPEDLPINIVYEDSDILIINKAQGMVVHPAPGCAQGTLVNALLYHCKDLSGINGVLRPGIVHRLDKDTTGLLVVAKNDAAHHALAEQIQNRTMKREYIAFLHGIIGEPAGIIDVPIGRDPRDRQRMAVVADGRPSVTHYKVLDRLEQYTTVLCSLETGRTHQIRVHMAYLGYPVAGDPKYGRRKENISWPGQALHAWHLHLTHPSSGEAMDFHADLPPFYRQVLVDNQAKNALELLDGKLTLS
jgi:23S rRNA pseudouridine1911/1915/1917 synthase